MLTLRIDFKNFHTRIKSKKNLKKKLKFLIKENSEILKSLSQNYKNNFNKKKLVKYKKFSNFRVIGMGGSILGTQAIYDFLNDKINKKFSFDFLSSSFKDPSTKISLLLNFKFFL